MKATDHLLVNSIVGLVLLWTGAISSWKLYALFVALGVLIDLDHLLFVAVEHRTLSPKKWIRAMRRDYERMQARLSVFHSPEFNLLLVVLAVFNAFDGVARLALLSNVLHLAMDVIAQYSASRSFDCIAAWSITRAVRDLVRRAGRRGAA